MVGELVTPTMSAAFALARLVVEFRCAPETARKRAEPFRMCLFLADNLDEGSHYSPRALASAAFADSAR